MEQVQENTHTHTQHKKREREGGGEHHCIIIVNHTFNTTRTRKIGWEVQHQIWSF